MSDTELGSVTSKPISSNTKCNVQRWIVILSIVSCINLIITLIILYKTFMNSSQIIPIIENNSRLEQDAELYNGSIQENSIMREYDKNYLKINSRTVWGATDSNDQLNRFNEPVRMVIIAHTDTHECDNFESCKLQMNILRLFYMQLRNFEDIGYNFLIGGDGAVYEGIGWKYIGYHTKGHNDYSIGIGFIGNYQNRMPSDNQMNAAILLLNQGVENNYLTKDYDLVGQRDFLPIVSPGNNIYNQIKKWDHFKKG